MKYTILDKAFLSLTGEDVFAMLHGITTNDIYKIEEQKCQYHHMLNPSGRYLFDFFIYSHEGGVLIEIEKEQAKGLKNKLMMYKLRSKVKIEDVSEDYQLIFSEENLPDAYISQTDPRFEKMGKRNIFTKEAASEFYKQTEATHDGELYNSLRYHYAIPEGLSDFTPEKSLIQEFGVDYLNGIDYDKGCYVGQEVISRTKHVGTVRKKIYSASAVNSVELSQLQQGAEIRMDGKRIGNIRSGYKDKGISLIRIQNYEDNKSPESQILADNMEINLRPTLWQG